MFRDYANNPVYPLTNDTILEPIDTLDMRDYICADESFCPDPCCSRTSNRDDFCYHEICKEKNLQRQESLESTVLEANHSCRVNNFFNQDFMGLIKNQWNLSCICTDSGFIFRFDTLRCVDLDECKLGQVCPGENEECVNTIGG